MMKLAKLVTSNYGTKSRIFNEMGLRNKLQKIYLTQFLHTNGIEATSKTIEVKETDVSAFGNVWINSPFSVKLNTLDSLTYPNSDKAFVKVNYSSVEEEDDALEECKGLVNVEQKESDLTVSGSVRLAHLLTSGSQFSELKIRNLELDVVIPVYYGISVNVAEDADICVGKIPQSDYCYLDSEKGDISVNGLKSPDLNIKSESGDLTLNGTIQGDVKLYTGTGSIKGGCRFLGTLLEAFTGSGNISVESCYSEKSVFGIRSGSMKLHNIHQDCTILVVNEGEVEVKGFDGILSTTITSGLFTGQISRIIDDSFIKMNNGEIVLKLSGEMSLNLCVRAPKILLDPEFKSKFFLENVEQELNLVMNKDEGAEVPTLFVEVSEKGSVKIETQDWISSMGLES